MWPLYFIPLISDLLETPFFKGKNRGYGVTARDTWVTREEARNKPLTFSQQGCTHPRTVAGAVRSTTPSSLLLLLELPVADAAVRCFLATSRIPSGLQQVSLGGSPPLPHLWLGSPSANFPLVALFFFVTADLQAAVAAVCCCEVLYNCLPTAAAAAVAKLLLCCFTAVVLMIYEAWHPGFEKETLIGGRGTQQMGQHFLSHLTS